MTAAIMLASLALASPAPNMELALDLVRAERYWGTHIECVRVIPTLRGRRLAAADIGLPDWTHYGDTGKAPILPACNIWINPKEWRRERAIRRCDTIVHEYGHLLGRQHTTDGTVMDPLRTRRVAVCR